ncbi:glycosyltransferase [Algoriphagus aquimarinus]|uniref:Glycosyltransferase, GT2 family n=1 Tax=Algoriphagus aquimarinus TaxID=237018 RepID=A0A1I1CDD3_9BACT|nr:glycosyltransferase [Algoriphagus aquimarinus]SFB60016.1 Glycosyltransferase, GT2 family [Algoriphagus aquimarinus]
MRFGGFIITYNRPETLVQTIQEIFNQTYQPELLWIIDNSENLETDHVIASLLDDRLKYYRMGYNSGPAGGAAKGLELCGEEGLDWIYWGDDNDPPFRLDCFERLLAIRDENPFAGVLGTVGQFFDRKKGVIKRVQTQLLEKKEWIEVDYVAGGMSMLVSGKVAKEGIAPNIDLFFGFEELDFCLKVSQKGYAILVDCSLFLEARKLHNRIDFERPTYHRKQNLNREYYSLRNLLMISDTMTFRSMKKRLQVKWLMKSLYGFRHGIVYGGKNFRMIWLAFYHFWIGVKGKTIQI